MFCPNAIIFSPLKSGHLSNQDTLSGSPKVSTLRVSTVANYGEDLTLPGCCDEEDFVAIDSVHDDTLEGVALHEDQGLG